MWLTRYRWAALHTGHWADASRSQQANTCIWNVCFLWAAAAAAAFLSGDLKRRTKHTWQHRHLSFQWGADHVILGQTVMEKTPCDGHPTKNRICSSFLAFLADNGIQSGLCTVLLVMAEGGCSIHHVLTIYWEAIVSLLLGVNLSSLHVVSCKAHINNHKHKHPGRIRSPGNTNTLNWCKHTFSCSQVRL